MHKFGVTGQCGRQFRCIPKTPCTLPQSGYEKKAPTFGRGLLVSIVLTAAEAGAAVVAEVAGSVSYGD